MRRLGSVLKQFAGECSEAIGTSDERRDLEADAMRIVQLGECRAWIASICSERPGLTPCDAGAAVVSVYAEVVTASFRGLYSAYWGFIAELLRRILRPALRAIRIEIPARELHEDVLMAMAAFFLDALRTLESDPNRLPWQPRDGRPLTKRPYGWSPSCDPLGTNLSLLLTRQGGRTRWSKALLYSPLAYCLRAAGMAEIKTVDQRFCGVCRKRFPERAGEETCSRCGSRLTTTKSLRLLAKRFVQGLPGDADAPSEDAERDPKDDPSRKAEQMEDARRNQRIALRHAKGLWRETMRGHWRDLRKMAVLLGLTGLETMPEPREWARPRPRWLKGIVRRLGRGSLKGDGTAGRSCRMLSQIAEILHIKEPPVLTAGNIRTIISRFRKLLQGKG